MRPQDITVGSRHRKEVGWLDSLERSIEYRGLLQPIGVDPDGMLLFGARRLQACKNLGWEDVPVRVIDVDADDPAAALKMERDENDVRKDFTPSEKVAIAQSIEEAMAGRHGSNQYQRKEEVQESAPPQGRSRDIAAEAVGWSGETYRQAKTVTESGDEETKEAMDSGEQSVNAAYKRATGKKAPKHIKITLDAGLLESEANAFASKAGKESAVAFAMAVLQACGQSLEVEHYD